jgi:superfamily II DNA or RNA helicase
LKTLILTHRIVLVKQWEKSIRKFCPESKVQYIQSKSRLDKDADFYIINAGNISKKGTAFFKGIGVCIVDECHLILAELLSKSLHHILPRYLIGLSATPYRFDEYDGFIDLYFGKNKIFRKLNRKHKVYHVSTGFTPKYDTNQQGRINWNSVIDSQSYDTERNELIVKIVKHFKDRVFLNRKAAGI